VPAAGGEAQRVGRAGGAVGEVLVAAAERRDEARDALPAAPDLLRRERLLRLAALELAREQAEVVLRRFREAGSAILLGTDSFWEGVDVPGPALRVLLLAKLPFKAPTEPLTAARLERLTEQGLDGFMDYLVPRAALKLKQGFGRLIRSRSDAGVVVLMDHRIVSRRYGAVLQASLPPAQRVEGPWGTVHAAIEAFFARHGIGTAGTAA